MTATAAEALELALWLHRAPARRAALLGRPLPDGIGQLLRVAGGARDQVAAAATITGEDEATVLEAVRFYLQQILFHEDADAYRVLGLRPDDSQQRAREHHRLLQQWLHPDRSGEDAWESVYATRINQAWSQLRTPQARAAYDAMLAGPPQGNRSRFSGDPLLGGSAARIPAAHPPATRSRNLTLVVIAGCIGLLALTALRQETPPQWPDAVPSLADAAPAPETQDAEAPLAALGAALTQAMAAPEEAPVPPVAVRPPAPAPATPEPAGKPRVVPKPATTAPAPSKFAQVAAASLTVPARPPAPPVEAAPAPARGEEPAVRPAAAAALPSAPAATVATVVPGDPPIAVPVTTVSASAPPPPPVQVPDAYRRMSQAQERTRAILAFLGDPSAGAPPVWNDLATMQHAQQLRTALLARRDHGRGTALELEAPKWRLSAEGARLESRYRSGAEQGELDLAFTWRENQLLVSGISLDPDA